jgi:hypothetical protein
MLDSLNNFHFFIDLYWQWVILADLRFGLVAGHAGNFFGNLFWVLGIEFLL